MGKDRISQYVGSVVFDALHQLRWQGKVEVVTVGSIVELTLSDAYCKFTEKTALTEDLDYQLSQAPKDRDWEVLTRCIKDLRTIVQICLRRLLNWRSSPFIECADWGNTVSYWIQWQNTFSVDYSRIEIPEPTSFPNYLSIGDCSSPKVRFLQHLSVGHLIIGGTSQQWEVTSVNWENKPYRTLWRCQNPRSGEEIVNFLRQELLPNVKHWGRSLSELREKMFPDYFQDEAPWH